MTLKLTWLGHAAFLVETQDIRILLDPYRAPDVGAYAPIDIDADLVLASHLNDKYHSHWQAARGRPVRLNALDFADNPRGVQSHGITFRAVRVWESAVRDVPVAMPYFSLAGLRLVHMGDLGHALSPTEAAPLQDCDLLLAVAGGPPTIPLPELREAITLINPRLVIPMHYQNGKINLPLAPIDDLLTQTPPIPVVRHPSPTLTVTRETLPEQTTCLILPSAR